MKLVVTCRNVILRDFVESDIEKRIYWETTQTEWRLWDAPWEYEGLTESEKEENLKKYIQNMRCFAEKRGQMPENERRSSFEITTNDTEQKYIGWVGSYRIDDDCKFANGDG